MEKIYKLQILFGHIPWEYFGQSMKCCGTLVLAFTCDKIVGICS